MVKVLRVASRVRGAGAPSVTGPRRKTKTPRRLLLIGPIRNLREALGVEPAKGPDVACGRQALCP